MGQPSTSAVLLCVAYQSASVAIDTRKYKWVVAMALFEY